ETVDFLSRGQLPQADGRRGRKRARKQRVPRYQCPAVGREGERGNDVRLTWLGQQGQGFFSAVGVAQTNLSAFGGAADRPRLAVGTDSEAMGMNPIEGHLALGPPRERIPDADGAVDLALRHGPARRDEGLTVGGKLNGADFTDVARGQAEQLLAA